MSEDTLSTADLGRFLDRVYVIGAPLESSAAPIIEHAVWPMSYTVGKPRIKRATQYNGFFNYATQTPEADGVVVTLAINGSPTFTVESDTLRMLEKIKKVYCKDIPLVALSALEDRVDFMKLFAQGKDSNILVSHLDIDPIGDIRRAVKLPNKRYVSQRGVSAGSDVTVNRASINHLLFGE